jgi:iron complex outermembrane receptor protein
MSASCRLFVVGCAVIAFSAGPAVGLAAGEVAQNPPTQDPPTQDPPAQDPVVTAAETVVVSASKIEQQLVDAPATMTVIGARALEVAPSGSYADLLRGVPGLNITQISARDINVTSRSATSSLATSQLAVVDGRSIYQDFFGFTMWDFMPANLNEIKRIEVIRGPASAVWGANALNGVINVITKTPREMEGTSVTFGLGSFDREAGGANLGAGSLFYVRGTHAEVIDDRWSYKISAGAYGSDAFARPAGEIPNGTGTVYPNYANTGTTQPKVDGRVDYDFADGVRKLEISGGLGATDGVMHTGIGPFDIATAKLGYWKLNYTSGALKVQTFMNILDGDASNFLSVDEAGSPVLLDFNSKTFDVEISDARVFEAQHIVTYGGNLRFNRFDLTIAPGETGRTEGGLYIQDEFIPSEKYRIVAGGRIDKFSSIEGPVFSPRLALVIKPQPDQSVRVSYNRAFRAPSMVNNHLDLTIANPLPLGLIPGVPPPLNTQTFLVPTDAMGNLDLREEHIDAFEISYTGNLQDRALVSAAVYYTWFDDQILFTQTGEWGPFTPPPGWPLPPIVWAGLYQSGIRFPSEFTYLNLGTVKDKGIELGIDGRITNEISAFANYAYRAAPEPEFPGLTPEEALTEINLPANHGLNLGVSYVSPTWYGTFNISHSSEAFWQDVLDARFHGSTDGFTLINLTAGYHFQDRRYSAALKINNLANQEVLQHIFGDVIKRSIVGELTVRLPR